MAQDLRSCLEDGTFWYLERTRFLQVAAAAFAPEIERLKNAQAPIESCRQVNNDPSPSRLLFRRQYAEVDRTLTGLLALKWLINDDYDTFVTGQKPTETLSSRSFQDLRNLFLGSISETEDQLALIVSIIVNDVGKDPDLAKDLPHGGSSGWNHDTVLYDAVTAGLIPSLLTLDERRRAIMVAGIKLGTTLNLAQFVQAENVPGSLAPILSLQNAAEVLKFKFLEVVLDVAGAAGHVSACGCLTFVEPSFQSFIAVHQALAQILQGQASLRQVYDHILVKRSDLVRQDGFQNLHVEEPEDRTFLRLLTMGRVSTADRATLYDEAFQSLSAETRANLVLGLNVDGYKDGTAILPYYMPALFQVGMKNTASQSRDIRVRALASLMRFLARVLEGTRPMPGTPGKIVECDLMFAKATVASEEFVSQPEVLDEVEIERPSEATQLET